MAWCESSWRNATGGVVSRRGRSPHLHAAAAAAAVAQRLWDMRAWVVHRGLSQRPLCSRAHSWKAQLWRGAFPLPTWPPGDAAAPPSAGLTLSSPASQ
ncbi:hypothetical protein JYU34_021217 [Plutella xylostella]|uniref:Uncharacterized protein n=1 Tax=Plutella xylostella TaxID=51655 RepID=A0ABQ7PT27_PLUXY|nr:hypothetical protein JYU34_021217 [Plutella xylostella]